MLQHRIRLLFPLLVLIFTACAVTLPETRLPRLDSAGMDQVHYFVTPLSGTWGTVFQVDRGLRLKNTRRYERVFTTFVERYAREYPLLSLEFSDTLGLRDDWWRERSDAELQAQKTQWASAFSAPEQETREIVFLDTLLVKRLRSGFWNGVRKVLFMSSDTQPSYAVILSGRVLDLEKPPRVVHFRLVQPEIRTRLQSSFNDPVASTVRAGAEAFVNWLRSQRRKY